MKRQGRPRDVSAPRYSEVIEVRSELAARYDIKESLLHACSVLGPVFVLERRYVIKNQIGILGIILRRVIEIKRAPRRIVTFDERLEFVIGGRFRGGPFCVSGA